MTNTTRKITLLAAAAAAVGSGVVASAADAGVTSTREGVCLNRSSDGYNQCWGEAGPSYGEKWQTYGCDTYFVRFDGNTPANGHGVGRTNAIAIQGKSWNIDSGFYVSTPLSAWQGPGGLAGVSGLTRDTFGQVDIYLGQANSYANVRVQASGPEGCNWHG